MRFAEAYEAYEDAERTIRAVDNIVAGMARMIVGRLRSSNASMSTLAALKRELRDYNMHTGTWKERL